VVIFCSLWLKIVNNFFSTDKQNAKLLQRKRLCTGYVSQEKYITEQRRKLHAEYSPNLQYFLDIVSNISMGRAE
jgi:hypothetical protein